MTARMGFPLITIIRWAAMHVLSAVPVVEQSQTKVITLSCIIAAGCAPCTAFICQLMILFFTSSTAALHKDQRAIVLASAR
jgi:hypothetical protein